MTPAHSAALPTQQQPRACLSAAPGPALHPADLPLPKHLNAKHLPLIQSYKLLDYKEK